MYQIKKHFFLWGAIVMLAGVFCGCTKQLNQVPQATANAQAIFGSVQGLQLYANSFYDKGLPQMDNIYKTDAELSDYGAQSSCPTYLQQGAYSSRITPVADWGWDTLRNINYFIQGLATSPVDTTDKNNFMGLAKFFRAWFYFGMVGQYGDVPWINTALAVNDTAVYGHRSPRLLVIDSVIADLQYAATHITATTDGTASTITKYTAYGLLSRVCLFEGTYQKYQFGQTAIANALLQQAVTAAQQVISGGGFSIYTGAGTGFEGSYRSLFISSTPVAQEVMLSEVASQSLAVLNDANWFYTSATYGNRFSFIRTFINTYLNSDGTPFTNIPGHDTMTFIHEMANRDARLYQTIRTPGYTRTNNGTLSSGAPVFSSYTYTGYQPIKWCLQDQYYDQAANNTNSICLMRYAEILLNYAEAREELGQLTDADWAMTVGVLRGRAGITGGLSSRPAVVDTYLQSTYFPDISDPVLLEIRRERGIELALEGFRFNDLARWNHGNLLTLTWNGIYVPALNLPMDLNGDGYPDVCFYQNTAPSPADSGVAYVNVTPAISSGTNPQILTNGTSGELNWLDNIPRTWSGYMYLYPIPYSQLLLNPNLTQNPGW